VYGLSLDELLLCTDRMRMVYLIEFNVGCFTYVRYEYKYLPDVMSLNFESEQETKIIFLY
jgi:hypothetical protein